MAYRYDEEGKKIETKASYATKTEEIVRVGWVERFFNNHVKVIAMLCTLLVVGACFWGIERLKESGVFEENKELREKIEKMKSDVKEMAEQADKNGNMLALKRMSELFEKWECE